MERSVNHSNQQTDAVSLKEVISKLQDWLNYLLKKWKIILICTIAGSAAGIGYSFLKEPIYTSSTSFVLEGSEKGGGLGQYADLASMVGIDINGSGGGGIFQGDNILELYKSRTMIVKTLLTEIQLEGKPILLVDRYIDFNKLRSQWKSKPELHAIHFKADLSPSIAPLSQHTRLQDSILSTIVEDINKNYLSVDKPDKQLSIIIAQVKAKDEFFAKAFNDEIVKNVNDFYIQTRTKKSVNNLKILQDKTDSVRLVLNKAIYSGAVALDATPNLNITRQIQRIVPTQRSQVSAETNKAILSELVKNLELSKIALLKATPLIQIIDQPVYPLERKKFGKAKGLVIGGFLGGFLVVSILLLRKIFKEILN